MSTPSSSTPAATAPPAVQGAVRLLDWGVIRAQGEDAASFLQGQVTNDVRGLGADQARLAGYCSAKGRLLATFVVWREAGGDILLACSADLLAATLKRLSMFVLRAKCKLSDASGEAALWGLAGEATLASLAMAGDTMPQAPWTHVPLGTQGQVIRLPDARIGGSRVPRALFAVAAGAAAPVGLPHLDESAWRWLEVMSGTARIVAATSEQFVPQMVNLELVGGVNFQKGCYPGQEVVARSQYRGTLKRRAYIVRSAEAVQPGQEVFHDADPGQPAGMVVLGGAHAGAFAGLVELKTAATEGGTLHLGQVDGATLQLDTLPYAMPSLAA